MDIITPIIIAVLLITGVAVHHYAGVPDTCAEEFVEEVLRIEGVNIDFSAAEHRAAREKAAQDRADEAKKARALLSAGD